MSKVLVPISGGKDSQLCLQLAIDTFGVNNVRGLFCDTQYEHPVTYTHIERMRHHYGVRIDVAKSVTVEQMVLKYRRFPNMVQRFCTDHLKIKPTIQYAHHMALFEGPFEIWYGMRTGESTLRAHRYGHVISDDLYPPHEFMPSKYPKYLHKLGVSVRLPIVDWTTEEVMGAVGDWLNPLYMFGFDRVGCFPCLATGDKAKEQMFQFDAVGRSRYTRVMELEIQLGKRVWLTKGGLSRNQNEGVCSICMI